MFYYKTKNPVALKLSKTLKTVFDHISKRLEVCQKYFTARRIFNSLLYDENLIKHTLSCLIYSYQPFYGINFSLWLVACDLIQNKQGINKRPTSTHEVMALYSELMVPSFSSLQSYLGLRGSTGTWQKGRLNRTSFKDNIITQVNISKMLS